MTTNSKLDYYRSLPSKRMGAGCLLLNQKSQILLVKPNYKPVWEIPGGIVEKDESPRYCCQREVHEEIGLHLEIGRLLVVDYNAPTDAKTESLMFIFDGGTLTAEQIPQIKIQTEELGTFDFFTPSDLPEEMTATLRNRLLAAYGRLMNDDDVYLENQE